MKRRKKKSRTVSEKDAALGKKEDRCKKFIRRNEKKINGC